MAAGRRAAAAPKPVRGNRSRYARLNRLTDETGLLVVQRDGSGRVVMSDGTVTLVLCPGMSSVVVDGRALRVGAGIRADDAGVLIPENALVRIRAAVRDAILQAVHKVVIDPGHGGSDPGAIGRAGLEEKAVNLAVSLRLAKILEKRGIEVVLTRRSDVFIELDERVRMCNREKPDLFVSIHANAAEAGDVTGVETFYVREAIDDFDRARRTVGGRPKEVQGMRLGGSDSDLGMAMYHTLFDMSRRRSADVAGIVNRSLCKKLDSPDRGVREAGFRVLKGAECPAILVEIGFLSNVPTERKLMKGEYLDKVAEAVAAGI